MARTESRAMSLIRALNIAPPGVAPPGVAGPRVGLVATAPADAAVETQPPPAIELLFSGAVRLTAFAVTDGRGARVGDSFSIGLIPTSRHRVPVSRLAAGDYTVAWRARPADRQPIGGTFRFAVAGPDA